MVSVAHYIQKHHNYPRVSGGFRSFRIGSDIVTHVTQSGLIRLKLTHTPWLRWGTGWSLLSVHFDWSARDLSSLGASLFWKSFIHDLFPLFTSFTSILVNRVMVDSDQTLFSGKSLDRIPATVYGLLKRFLGVTAFGPATGEGHAHLLGNVPHCHGSLGQRRLWGSSSGSPLFLSSCTVDIWVYLQYSRRWGWKGLIRNPQAALSLHSYAQSS